MALSEEFEEYLTAGVSPKARGLLRKAALSMPKDKRAGFLASLQQADFEFQVPIQDRMPEGANLVDPSKFRHHDYGSEVPGESMNLNLKGLYVRPDYGKIPENASQDTLDSIKKYNPSELEVGTPYRQYFFPLEPDTVNTYGLGNNPLVIAHEYRHRQGLEGLVAPYRTAPNREYLNKVQDLVGATNEKELRGALLTTAFTFSRLDRGKDYVERNREIQKLARNPNTSLEKLAEGARFFIKNPISQDLMRQSIELESKAKTEAEEAGEDPALKDTMSANNFRTSSFYNKNIKEKSFLDKLRQAIKD